MFQSGPQSVQQKLIKCFIHIILFWKPSDTKLYQTDLIACEISTITLCQGRFTDI